MAWPGLVWRARRAVQLDAVYIRCSCFVAICDAYAFVRVAYIDVFPLPRVYGAQRRGSRLEEMGLRDRPRVENRNII